MTNEFISCDWGTSSFRLRLVEAPSLNITAEESSDEGNAHVFEAWQQAGQAPEQRTAFYQAVIRKHLEALASSAGRSLDKLPIIISGMASSTIGMVEVPYKDFPFAADGRDLSVKRLLATADFPHDILLVSGVKTADDVMRGEEVQLVGCELPTTAEDVLFLHPGTHAKHVTVRQGQAQALATYMTGEFFSLLSGKSILAASVAKRGALSDEANRTAFEQGFQAGRTANLLHAAFLVRTNDLFGKLPKPANFHYLSGLLIGSELRELRAQSFAHIYMTGEPALLEAYQLALQLIGIDSAQLTVKDAVSTTLRGHWAVLQRQEV